MRVVYQRLLSGINMVELEAEMNAPPRPPRARSLSPIRSFVGQPCPYCAHPMQVNGDRGVTRDHAHVPYSKGGMLCERNRIIVCWTCNGDKKDRTLVEWYVALARGRDVRATIVLAVIERENVQSLQTDA